MESLLSICLGIGLSAACGFRVFVPFLVMSLAAQSGHTTLAQGFEWIGTPAALATFATAAGLEIAAYYVPWVDNLMDSIAGPAAVVAGTLITASGITDMSPMMRWTLAVVAGGGSAAVVQGATTLVRGASTAMTGGLGNPVVATAEMGLASVLSLAAFAVPVLTALIVLTLVFFVARRLYHRFSRANAAPAPVRTSPPDNLRLPDSHR